MQAEITYISDTNIENEANENDIKYIKIFKERFL